MFDFTPSSPLSTCLVSKTKKLNSLLPWKKFRLDSSAPVRRFYQDTPGFSHWGSSSGRSFRCEKRSLHCCQPAVFRVLYRAKPVPITKLKPRTFYGRHSRIEIWNVLGFKNLPSNHVRRVMGRVPHFHHGVHSPYKLQKNDSNKLNWL